jgi:predicted RNase H-like HicB family nuclease
MKILNYKVLLRKENEGGYTVTVPSLPGCVTYGATIDESLLMVKEAIEGYIESLKEHGEAIPSDQDLLEYNLTIHADE